MPLLLALSAAAAPHSHLIQKVFDVSLGKPAGDLEKVGFQPDGTAHSSWTRSGDRFFDDVRVDVDPTLSLVEAVTATKRYAEGDRKQRQQACEADLETVAASLRAKYPTLKAAWTHDKVEFGRPIGPYLMRMLKEPELENTKISDSRTVTLSCDGPSAFQSSSKQAELTFLFLSYNISQMERVPINRAFVAEQQRQERERARQLGIDANKL